MSYSKRVLDPQGYGAPPKVIHLSLLCRIQQGIEHKPCSGTADCCDKPCGCECHVR